MEVTVGNVYKRKLMQNELFVDIPALFWGAAVGFLQDPGEHL
jgi:hypothetical protein